MQLNFGNMTMEVNVFNMYKKPMSSDKKFNIKGVCIIDTLVDEHMESLISPNVDGYYEGSDEMNTYAGNYPMENDEKLIFEPP